MHLTIADKESNTWIKLKAFYEDRRKTLREQNDGPMPEDQRNRLIGRIDEINILLALEQEKVVAPAQQVWE